MGGRCRLGRFGVARGWERRIHGWGSEFGEGGRVESRRMELYLQHWRYLLVALAVCAFIRGISVHTEGVNHYRPGLVREELIFTFNVEPVCL